MDVGERIKQFRKEKGFTQQVIADKLGLKRQTIAAYEIGTVTPSDRTITDICREFDVNEHWLRTGDGKMFAEPSEFSLDDLAKQCNADELDLKIVKKYFELPANIRRMLVDHFKSVFVEETSGQERPTEQKTPTLVSESGLNDDEESFMKSVAAMSPGQQEKFFQHYKQMYLMREQQKDASATFSPPAHSDKAPGSESPNRS